MPVRHLPGDGLPYYLLLHDEHGRERRERDGTLLSDRLRQHLLEQRISDVFVISHGWQSDVPGAIDQYDRWVTAMLSQQDDRRLLLQRRPGFRPLVVGLHWPSRPWGDERIPLTLGGGETPQDVRTLVADYAHRIADTARARRALRVILEARDDLLTDDVAGAYSALFEESRLSGDGPGAPPGHDQDGFDPHAIIEDAPAGSVLGAPIRERGVDLLRLPLRQLSFWAMKDRARRFGESGAHDLLQAVQTGAPIARLHLMGHSFGAIVVSAALAGPPGGNRLPHPVASMFLVQAAMSLWAFSDEIPAHRGVTGYFHPILRDRLIGGPLLSTRSEHDRAVGLFYPRGAQLARQLLLGDDLPRYGAIGTYGIRGVRHGRDLPMQPVTSPYDFAASGVYNLEAGTVIRAGQGLSGAHSDIAHPEVAHAFWQAAMPIW